MSVVTCCASVNERIHSSSSNCFSCMLRKNLRRWAGPAKETMASRCSCRSPVGPGALMGASFTCGADEMPDLLRPGMLCCLTVFLLGRVRTAASASWNETVHCFWQSVERPFIALLMDPLAVCAGGQVGQKARLRTTRRSGASRAGRRRY